MLTVKFKYDNAVINRFVTLIPTARCKWKFFSRYWEVDDADLYLVCAALKDHDPKLVSKLRTAPEYAEARRLSEAKMQSVAASRATSHPLSIPAPVGWSYLPFQRAGVAFLMDHLNALVGDEMGLGKTIEAIGLITMTKPRTVLVICPANLKLNWGRELARWLVQPYEVRVLKGYPRKADTLPANDKFYIWIVNYDILSKWVKILDQRWDIIICDEAHYAKNYRKYTDSKGNPVLKGSGRAIYTFALLEKANRKVMMTGTPIVNRPIELWPFLHALDPKRWSDFWHFATRYCEAYSNSYGWVMTGAANLEELQQKMRETVLLRRLKSEVLKELPSKRRQVIEVPAAGEMAAAVKAEAAFEAELEAIREALSNIPPDAQDYLEQAKKLTKNYREVNFTEISRLRHLTAVAKVPACIEFIDQVLENKSKVVVFAHHHDVIKPLLAHYGNRAVHLLGGDSSKEKDAAVERFQTDPSIEVFVGSLLAAGVGLTLTAADTVVFCELDWVPGVITQAEDRCHRIGQLSSLNIYHLVVEGSLDAKLVDTLIRKQAVCDKALNEEVLPARVSDDLEEFVDLGPKEPSRTIGAEFAAHHPEDRPIEVLSEEDENEDIGIEPTVCVDERQRAHVHFLVRYLAGLEDGGAVRREGQGFNKLDAEIGNVLAEAELLTDKQFFAAQKLLKRYHGQFVGVKSPALSPTWRPSKPRS